MTVEIGMVLGMLGLAVVLFSLELLRVDVVAILIMLLLAWAGLVTPEQAFSGLASGAVVSIISVMIIGQGIERSGITRRLASPVIRLSGGSEGRLVAVVSVAAGLISAFMQNIGAAALFLPAVTRIARRMRFPVSRILMPLGFAAILGGTLTLVGSGPLIILNDLLRQQGFSEFGLFSVTPVGLALLAGGVLYFYLFGRRLLPSSRQAGSGGEGRRDLVEEWRLSSTVSGYRVAAGSDLAGLTVEEAGIWSRHRLNLLALRERGDVTYAPWRYSRLARGQELALLGDADAAGRFAAEHGLERIPRSDFLDQMRPGGGMEFAELIVPPKSPVAGQSLRRMGLRKRYAVEPVMLIAGDEEHRGDFSDVPLLPGHILVVYGRTGSIIEMGDRRTFALITPLQPSDSRPAKPRAALLCFAGAVALVVAGMPLQMSLLSGALAMILSGVIGIDEAYRAVDWRTVFLIAGLIPLGIAMEQSGAAAWVAGGVVSAVGPGHPFALCAAVAVMATLFSLFMSNVAATVLLVPLVIVIGEGAGLAPRGLALLTAVCASNSFVLPTHQVNALLISPGGYRSVDYLRVGGIMTLIFLCIAVPLVYYLFM
ncbi:MAG: SLC13 family permease [Candidatus Krumholzibacteria bacterium]|nr:SLC13 family permease [Candidatus Krumholzibacteria bacterium]